MERIDVLVVGAGPSGLMAAYTLAKGGKKVTVLEACSRTGGRIHTIDNAIFFNQAELGAEFIHGNLPVTLDLLKEANIPYESLAGDTWQHKDGRFTQDSDMGADWGLLMEALHNLKADMTLDSFLDKYFPGEKFAELRTGALRYASGYDSCDPSRVSVFSLRREWENEDEEAQYRLKGGYCSLIQYFVSQIRKGGGEIYLNAAVKDIQWQNGRVKAITADGEHYEACSAILALPLGVWQAPEGAKGTIKFDPPITAQLEGLQQLGFGAVIKVLLQFKDMFWKSEAVEHSTGQNLKDLAFLISTEAVPVWWTQLPSETPLLTGWLGGPAAAKHVHTPNEEILEQSLQSLSNLFKLDLADLKAGLVAWHIANWTSEPYIRGAYAYDTLATSTVVPMLKQSVNDVLYFAGEFMYQGPAMGTVEAALTSGKEAAEEVLRSKL